MRTLQFRQGDVLLEIVDRWGVPSSEENTMEDAKDGKVVLAAGETTGHDHVLTKIRDSVIRRFVPNNPAVRRSWEQQGEDYLKVDGRGGALFQHVTPTSLGDHFGFHIPAGIVRRIRQRVWDPTMGERQVVD